MNRFTFLLLLSCAVLATVPVSADAKEGDKPTIEEETLLKSFAAFNGALVYDEVCKGTDPKSRYDFKNPENVNLAGSEQMLAARLGGLQHVRFPDESVEEVIQRLTFIKKKIYDKSRELLEKNGCDSQGAQQAEKALMLYSQTSPEQVMAIIDEHIKELGGKVTSSKEVDAVKDTAGKKAP